MRRTGTILALDLLLLALCAFGAFRFAQKAAFPARTEERSNVVVITQVLGSAQSELRSGDTIVSIAGQRIHSDDEIEFICTDFKKGDAVSVQVLRSGTEMEFSVPFVADYSLLKIVIECIVGSFYLLIGIVVLLLQKKERAAHAFHHLCVAIASLIFLTSGYLGSWPFGSGYILEVIFEAFYTLVPVFFVHFTLLFPFKKFPSNKKILVPLYSTSFILAVWAGSTFLYSAYPHVDLVRYGLHKTAFDFVEIYFAILFFYGFGNIIHAYMVAKEDFERRKLRWIFFGIFFGASSFIFFWLIPRIFWDKGILPEEVVLALSLIAPVSFAIAIVRFRVFDIDVLVKRSTAYAIVLGMLFILFRVSAYALSGFFRAEGVSSTIPEIVGALLIAILFEPMRRLVQKFVDVRFFRVSYDFHKAQSGFLEEIKFAPSRQKLAELVVGRTQAIVPVSRIAFFILEDANDKLVLLEHLGFDALEHRGIKLQRADLKTGLDLPVALDEKIEPGLKFESADREVFRRWKISLVIPMLSRERSILGFFVLGEKLSGARFTIEDISLLSSVCTQSGLALERIAVERKLFLEQAESERLGELNRLKSYFVSSVSHDLKTPLTSIRLFAELLKDREDLPREKAAEYLGIIEGEADRLSRLITNVLDFVKIEKGTKEYHPLPLDLNSVVHQVMQLLEYQIRSNGFVVSVHLCAESLKILGDCDAIIDAITNLLTNAMKYSPADRRSIVIRTYVENDYAAVSIEDQGYGIPQAETQHIFEPFYQIDGQVMKSAGGAGLGLSLVKHTMDGHQGRVEVRSEPGKGSIFVLYFPIHSDEKDSHH